MIKCDICTIENSESVVEQCSTCTFVACNTCIEEWFKCNNKDTCPQCKCKFKTPDYDNYNAYYNYVKFKKDSSFVIEEPITNPKYHKFLVSLKSASADALIVYDGEIVDNKVIKDCLYFDCEEGLWRPIISTRGKQFLMRNSQKLIYNKDRTKVFNKSMGKWISA